MAGIGSGSSDFRNAEVEQVYLLTRRRSSFPPPPPASTRLAVVEAPSEESRDSLAEFTRQADAGGIDQQWDEPADDIDDDISDVRVVRRFALRRRAIRVLGAFAIIGTLAGGTYVLQQPKVRHEALSFVTMGHEDAAVRAGRRVVTIVERLRHR
jgi:hypothetical protein